MTSWTLVADAGPSVGLGHLARSSALAGALRELEIEVVTLGLGAPTPVTIDGVEWSPTRDLDGLEAEAVVLDSYSVAAEVPARLARTGTLALFLDGEVPPKDAALVVDVGGAGEPDERLLLGLRFACLRRQFRDLPAADTRETVESVLVTTGGGDPDGIGTALAQVAAEALPVARVGLLRGPYAGGVVPAGVEVVSAAADTAALLRGADIVVTAGGQTLLEAAACGTPAVVVPSADNQLGNAARVREAGAARVLPSSAEGLSEALRALASDAGGRRDMAARGQAAVDGRGAHRVAERIAAL